MLYIFTSTSDTITIKEQLTKIKILQCFNENIDDISQEQPFGNRKAKKKWLSLKCVGMPLDFLTGAIFTIN